jgi:hypothetical protein
MTYPAIDIDEFNKVVLILEDAAATPGYLNPENCPYDPAVVDKIRQLTSFKGPSSGAIDEKKNPVGRPSKQVALPVSEIESELDELRKEIASLKADAKGLETKDRIDIVKARATLLEKAVGLRERTNGLKKQQKFISDVINIMDDVLEQNQREEVIEQLKKFLED